MATETTYTSLRANLAGVLDQVVDQRQTVSAVMPSESVDGATQLVVEASEAGARLDVFLARRKAVPSAAAARRALASGIVRVGGHAAKKGMHLQPGDVVEMGEDFAQAVVLEPTPDLGLAMLYQDDDLVAIDNAQRERLGRLRMDSTALIGLDAQVTDSRPSPRPSRRTSQNASRPALIW